MEWLSYWWVDALLSVWVLISLVLGWNVPATLLFLPKRKVKGGVKVVGGIATALLWPLMVMALIASLLVELVVSLKKGKLKW